jgi:hypothetical protein
MRNYHGDGDLPPPQRHMTLDGKFRRLDDAISSVILTLPVKKEENPRASFDMAVRKSADERDQACRDHAAAPTDATRRCRSRAQKQYDLDHTKAANLYYQQRLAVTKRRRPDGTTTMDQGEVWKVGRDLTGKPEWSPRVTKFVKDANGTLATTPEENVTNFCTHFSPIYNRKTRSEAWTHVAKFEPIAPDRSIRPPQMFQTKRAIQSIKLTASGRTGTSLEVWRTLALHHDALSFITYLFQECWRTETVPATWRIAQLLSIYKKYDPTLPKNYRLIFVEEHLYKAFQHFIKLHLDDHFEQLAPEFSNGFRCGRGCPDALFILKTVLRKRKEHGIASWLLLLDIKAAFDTVPRDLLWECLKRCGVPTKLIRMLQAMYKNRTAEMAIDGATSIMEVEGGTCQGALLAPRLFSYFIFTIFEIWLQENNSCATTLQFVGSPLNRQRGLQILLPIFNVADDTAAIFDSRPELEYHGISLIRLLAAFGMDSHTATTESIAPGVAPKTAILYVEPQGPNRNLPVDRTPISVGANEFIPLTPSYTYLGVLLHHTLSDDPEIDLRIQKANCYFGFLRSRIFASRTTHRSTKKLVYEGMVLAILLYGAESWIVSKRSERLLQSLHRRLVRTMCGTSMYHTRKHSIRSTDLEARLQLRSMRDYLDARILGYAGHVARMPTYRLPLQLLFSECPTTRPIGAPPLNYHRQLRTICKRKGMQSHEEWSTKALDRNAWRSLISTPTPSTQRTRVDYTGSRIHIFKGTTDQAGSILGETICGSIPKWIALLDNDTITSLSTGEAAKWVVPIDDDIEKIQAILNDPGHIVGMPIYKTYNGVSHKGKVIDTDYDGDDHNIWGVRYEDGDTSDYYARDILPLLLQYKRPPPLIGRHINKTFNTGTFTGKITDIDINSRNNETIWTVLYTDTDTEDINLSELMETKILPI